MSSNGIALAMPAPLSAESQSVVVRAVDDVARREWDDYVRGRPDHSLYHLYGWREVIRRAFGGETHYLAAYCDRRLVGVLPLGRLKSIVFGHFLVSLPYFNYGGILADDAAAARALWSEAARLAQKLGCSHIEFRHTDASLADAPSRTDKVTMLLELPSSSEALFKRLSSKLRSQIKRPQREGATVDSGGIELLTDFYAVFARNMRDLGTPVYAPGLFAAILHEFPSEARVFIVRLGGKPVAAAFLLGHNGMMEIPWASSLREANHLSVNMLLYWEVLKYSADQGCKIFDFGRSTLDSGTFKFKKQWGAQPKQLHWHYWLRDGGELPKLNPANPKYRLLIETWRRLPLPVANWLGPKLIKHLP